MRVLIVYDEVDYETIDDAKFLEHLVDRALDVWGWERGIDEVDIQIVTVDDLAN